MSGTMNGGFDPIRLSVAWLAILPASPFADIICGPILHTTPPACLPFADLGASVVLLAPLPMPFVLPSVSWAWLGPFLTFFLAGPLVLQLMSTVRPDLHLLQRAM